MSPRRALVDLRDARDAAVFGGKAAQLASAIAGCLPVPGGWALAWSTVSALCSQDDRALADELEAVVRHSGPLAVRSSAVGEDSRLASFAGMHASVLGVVGLGSTLDAIRQVHASAFGPAVLTYRRSLGIDLDPQMGIVLQRMVAADVAGVMFTRHPVTDAEELVIEASWGLGEAVVGGLVTPDHLRADLEGRVLEQRIGDKDVAVWLRSDGTTQERAVPAEQASRPCLGPRHVLTLSDLARTCDHVFGRGEPHDIEFAFIDDVVHLLQRRPLTDA